LIIQRNLIKEIIFTLSAVGGVLLLIFSSTRFVRFLAEVTTGKLSADIVFHLMGLKIVHNLVIILPLSFYLAVLLTLGRLYKDNEIMAMSACGIGPGKILRGVLLFSPIIVGLTAWLSLYVAPWTEDLSETLREQAEQQTEISSLVAGQFRESQDGNTIFYVETLSDDKSEMQNVFIQRRGESGYSVLSSDTAHLYTDKNTKDQYMVMQDGYRYEGKPGDPEIQIIKYKKHAVRIEEKGFVKSRRKMDAIPTAELWKEDNPKAKSQLQWRISMPISIFLLGILALPISKLSPREGRYARLFTGILIYVVYINLMGVAKDLVKREEVPDIVGMWWVHVLLLLVIIALYIYQLGPRWVFERISGKKMTGAVINENA
jgi:lipopolysaccharide export system permease protein